MTGTLKLADRPAYWLSYELVRTSLNPYTLAARAWKSEIEDYELTLDAGRTRIRNILSGHWPKPATLADVARALGRDPGYFYRSAAQAGDA